MSDNNTVDLVAAKIDTHEQVCAERYKRIEERMESGDKKFGRLENMIWGVYILMITSAVLPNLIK